MRKMGNSREHLVVLAGIHQHHLTAGNLPHFNYFLKRHGICLGCGGKDAALPFIKRRKGSIHS